MELDLTGVTDADHAVDVMLDEGTRLTILVHEIAPAGYTWTADTVGAVRVESSELDEADLGTDLDQPLVGGGSTRRIVIERVHDAARRQPPASVHLSYGLPWEDQPLRRITVRID